MADEVSKTPDAAKTGSNDTSQTAATGDAETTTVSKRGRKRKRPAAAVKPNKKKKGPVTRAQAAVKSAIKHQQKDGGPQKKRGAGAAAGDSRVTRSMRVAPFKIKMEVKEEPQEPEENTAMDEEELDEPMVDEPNPIPHTSRVVLEMPSFEDEEADLQVNMEIDIKKEPNTDNEPRSAVKQENVDTDYDTDLTNFLPDIPTIESVYSVADADNTGSLMNQLLEQMEQGRGSPQCVQTDVDEEPPQPDTEISELLEDCIVRVSDMLDNEEGMEVETPEPAVSQEEELDEVYSDSESMEPNDYYTMPDSSEGEEEEGGRDIKPSRDVLDGGLPSAGKKPDAEVEEKPDSAAIIKKERTEGELLLHELDPDMTFPLFPDEEELAKKHEFIDLMNSRGGVRTMQEIRRDMSEVHIPDGNPCWDPPPGNTNLTGI